MKKEKVVIVSGYFDPIHVGHLEYLQMASQLGDTLMVIINNDEQAKLKKYKKIAASKAMVKKELIKELDEVDQQLNAWLKKKDDENKKLRKFLDKKVKKKRKK